MTCDGALEHGHQRYQWLPPRGTLEEVERWLTNLLDAYRAIDPDVDVTARAPGRMLLETIARRTASLRSPRLKELRAGSTLSRYSCLATQGGL